MPKVLVTETPINHEVVRKAIEHYGSKAIAEGKTRVIHSIVEQIEKETGEKFISMEIGQPGIVPSHANREGNNKFLDSGVTVYPPPEGIPELKKEISRFMKLYLNVAMPEAYCIPTVGSINGCYASFMVAGRCDKQKNTILFADPGFYAHKAQVKMIGLRRDSFDVYYHRGEKLRAILTEKFENGKIAAILYSNPNNPTWMCLTEDELQIIAELAGKYNVIPIEDLAYFSMDFRKHYGNRGQPPFQPTIANYADKFVMLISSSKSFSNAGERIAMMAVPEKLYNSKYEDLCEYYSGPGFGNALVMETILLTTAGVSQSVQRNFTEILRSANDGEYNFIDEVKVYGERAEQMKRIFTSNGFSITYDKDGNEPIGDGFYFTVSFPGFLGCELSERLLYYGISSIPLTCLGGQRPEAIRVCMSFVSHEQMPLLDERLRRFYKDNKGV